MAKASTKTKWSKLPNTKLLRVIIFSLLAAMIILLSAFGYVYSSSPAVIRNPKLEHYHFRMQIILDGKPINFALKDFQQDYAKDQCSGELPAQPIHFHDNKDQFVHIHWDGMTGGLVLKNYGWNFIGGSDSKLGYRINSPINLDTVPTHGKMLPAFPSDAKFYVYIGDSSGFKEKSFEDFKHKDLEDFFGKKSNFPSPASSNLIDKLFPKAYAHAGHDHEETTASPSIGMPGAPALPEQERLAKINNLIGNVVIFVQQDKPTQQQIKDRFNNLVPLSESTCAG